MCLEFNYLENIGNYRFKFDGFTCQNTGNWLKKKTLYFSSNKTVLYVVRMIKFTHWGENIEVGKDCKIVLGYVWRLIYRNLLVIDSEKFCEIESSVFIADIILLQM